MATTALKLDVNMTDEITPKGETPQGDAPELEKEEVSVENTPTETPEGGAGSSQEQIDYATLLQVEKERAERAERALAEKRFKTAEQSRKREVDDDDKTIEDRPLTAKELQRILAQERQETQKTFEESRALDIARKYTSSDQEAEAAIMYWKNRVVPTGNLEEDMRFAIAGLNYTKEVSKNAELARALRSKDNVARNTATTHRDSAPGTSPRMSAGDESAYKQAGFEYDYTGKVWKKKLPNGKILVKDPKTKETKII